jgi:monosaccharide ABC transporter ATP-binding protein, CUT2 family (TC 3.A.1.2.-)
MTGRSFEKPQQKLLTDDKEDVLQVQNLCLKNGFQNISFSLKKGEILGITGLLGSGRTELVQSLFGYIPYDSGNVYVNGEKIIIKSVRDAIKNKIGYVPEDRLTEGLFLTQTIEKNIAVSKLNEYVNKAGFLDTKKMSEDVSKWIELLAIVTKNAEQAVQTLSGGNQQKVVLARWLAINLDILILNGPTVGVDIGTKYDIHDLIRKLAEKGVGIIIISDDIPEIMDTCHRILIMRSGKITDALLTAKTDQKQLVDLTTHN